jgi:hypothetical protein
MGRPAKVTQAKRNREMQKRMKQQDKEIRREQRKTENEELRPVLEGEDPDLIGLRPGSTSSVLAAFVKGYHSFLFGTSLVLQGSQWLNGMVLGSPEVFNLVESSLS